VAIFRTKRTAVQERCDPEHRGNEPASVQQARSPSCMRRIYSQLEMR
jgi:hypothetical protein